MQNGHSDCRPNSLLAKFNDEIRRESPRSEVPQVAPTVLKISLTVRQIALTVSQIAPTVPQIATRVPQIAPPVAQIALTVSNSPNRRILRDGF